MRVDRGGDSFVKFSWIQIYLLPDPRSLFTLWTLICQQCAPRSSYKWNEGRVSFKRARISTFSTAACRILCHRKNVWLENMLLKATEMSWFVVQLSVSGVVGTYFKTVCRYREKYADKNEAQLFVIPLRRQEVILSSILYCNVCINTGVLSE